MPRLRLDLLSAHMASSLPLARPLPRLRAYGALPFRVPASASTDVLRTFFDL